MSTENNNAADDIAAALAEGMVLLTTTNHQQQTLGEIPLIVDLIGLRCPEPLMMLRQAMRNTKAEDLVLVYATDQSTQRDFKRYVDFTGHQCLLTQVYECKQEGPFQGQPLYAYAILCQ